MEVVLII